MQQALTPAFGSHALDESHEKWRLKARQYGDNLWGRWMISLCRKMARRGQSEPFDVTITPDIRARLYPSRNRCEKRAFAGVQIWDATERLCLRAAVETCAQDVFVFIDVGANVGLYSLFVHSYCQAESRPHRLIAIEPSLESCRRLEDNITINQAPIQIIRSAISDRPGTGYLGGGEHNDGERHLLGARQEGSETVIIDTLARIARSQGLAHINAMKVDIEGHDYKALSEFFDTAPKRLFPELLIIETGHTDKHPLIELCESKGYALKVQTRINAVLVRSAQDRHIAKDG